MRKTKRPGSTRKKTRILHNWTEGNVQKFELSQRSEARRGEEARQTLIERAHRRTLEHEDADGGAGEGGEGEAR